MVHSLSACVAGALVLWPSATVALPSWFSPSFHPGNPSIPALPRSVAPPARPFKFTPGPHPPPPTVAAAWYAGWHGGAQDFPPEDVSWEKYTTVNYAFAETTPDPGNLTISADDDPILRRVVELGHEVGTSIMITVGGWTGSRFFSTAVGNAANRTKFINSLTNIVTTYNLDGIDFDWEYPGNQGLECNIVNANDSANFLQLLKELRASPNLRTNAILSAATAITPFLDEDGNPLDDVSEFAQYLDYIEIMNYDIWGPWSPTAGPNAPLNDTCVANNETQAVGSAVSAITTWTGAGFPLDQIVLGVAGYGHSYDVNHTAAFGVDNWNAKKNGLTLNTSYPGFDVTAQPGGDLWDDMPQIDVCGTYAGWGGLFDFWGLITNGFLDTNGTALPGIAYIYDDCTQTPSVYNATSGVWVAYDNADSFAAKGAYIKSIGLRGFSLWEAGGDFNDILLDSIRSGAGLPELSFDCINGEPVSTSRLYPTYATPALTSIGPGTSVVVTSTPTPTTTSKVIIPTTTRKVGHPQ